MAPKTQQEEPGAVLIDGKRYQLVRLPNSRQSYRQQLVNQPPWQDGEPAMPSDPQYTWHLGGFKSRAGLPGTSEYGKNTDGRWAFRLMPSAKINTVTLTNSTVTPSCIFEALGYIFACCGRYLFRIDPDDDSVVVSKDLGAGGTSFVMGLEWEGYALVTTDASTNSLWEIRAADIEQGTGGDADDWDQTSDVSAYRLATGINRLFVVTKTGLLKNVGTGLDPMLASNYGDSIQCGDDETAPTGMVAYERSVFVGKPEGMFGVGDDGLGLPLLRRMAKDPDNCFGMANYEPWVLVPHVRGLYRFVPGTAQSVGLEKELMNESPVVGRWKGFAVDDQWVYGLMAVGDETYVLAGRERSEDLGFGPMVWDTWLHFGEESKAILLSAVTGPQRLWFGHGENVAYVELAGGPGAVEYATSGQRFTYKMRFDDWGAKDFPGVSIACEDVSSSVYWTVNYSIDGGAFSNLDKSGNAMNVQSAGVKTFYLPPTAVGREIQFRLDYTSNNESKAGKVVYFEPFAVPASRKVQVVVCHLRLEQGVSHGQTIERRKAITQFNDLLALADGAASPVATSGPWGKNVNAKVRSVSIVDTVQEMRDEPGFIVELVLQLRKES